MRRFGFVVMLMSGLAVGTPSDLGEQSEILTAGKYNPASGKKTLLKDVKITQWEDEQYMEATIGYTRNGAQRWSKLNLLLKHLGGNRYRGTGRYLMRRPLGGGCFTPIALELRAYEKGFKFKRRQPALVDLDYCRFYNYSWFPSKEPLFLEP